MLNFMRMLRDPGTGDGAGAGGGAEGAGAGSGDGGSGAGAAGSACSGAGAGAAGAGAGAGAQGGAGQGQGQGKGQGAGTATTSWKGALRTDLKDSPLSQKFEDTPEGMNKLVESYANLEKLLGHEKVPLPKGPEDKEGWARFNKAMGIPEKADAYALKDVSVPQEMEALKLNEGKGQFADLVHKLGLRPDQAQGLWDSYTKMSMESYAKQMEAHRGRVADAVNALKQQWGDQYQSNIELGQMVINKFSGDQETNDFLVAVLAQDPRGSKFLAKVGEQFAENKMGEFQLKRFAMSPEAAREEIRKISSDPNHPYRSDKATKAEHDAAVDYVNGLHAIVAKSQRQA